MDVSVDGLVPLGKLPVFEYRPVVAVKACGNAVFLQYLARHLEIAVQSLLPVEPKPHGCAGRVIDGSVQRRFREAVPEPIVD